MTIYPKLLMLLGSGELGKEIAISAKRLGCKVVACDRYAGAPAMQVADYIEIFDMTNPESLKATIYKHKPEIIIPEIESLAVDVLSEIETEGITVIPNARATSITMNRDKIRTLANKELGIKTARFAYASSSEELKIVAAPLGWPVFVKPVMSSSGKGQSLVKSALGLENAWKKAIEGARGNSSQVIVEEFVKFDLEITLLTIRQKNGSTIFCTPIGHEQADGDYQCSWQPANLTDTQLQKAQSIAKSVTSNLGGIGLFGVEFFIRGEEVIFSELSPRPHDTGLVTLITQNYSEFELHLRAVLGIPIPEILLIKPGASRVILSKKNISDVCYKGIEKCLSEKSVELFLFGKPNARKGRRMGVVLASHTNIKEARIKADTAALHIEILEKPNANDSRKIDNA